MEHPWGLEYSESGVVNRGNLYVTNHHSVKCSKDAPTLAICIPSRGSIPVEVFMGLKRMAVPINVQCYFLYTRGLMGTSGRDTMTHQALSLGAQFLYFADDDVLPPPDVLYKMMQHMQKDPTIGLITGVYTTKSIPPHPHIYKEDGGAHYWGFSLSPYDQPEDIWGCGAGCIMVRADAIRQMETPYWAENVQRDNNKQVNVVGHDLLFCEKVREAGYRTVVDGSIQCDHFSESENKYYRLPKNSPPVERFKRDPRNDEYWMNWWGVSPNGYGRDYHDALQLLVGMAPQMEFVQLVNSGGGVFAQTLANILRERFVGLVTQDSEEEAFCHVRRLPVFNQVADDMLLILEPEELGPDHFVWEQVQARHAPLMIITRQKTEQYEELFKQGVWYVYGNQACRDWANDHGFISDSDRADTVSGRLPG